MRPRRRAFRLWQAEFPFTGRGFGQDYRRQFAAPITQRPKEPAPHPPSIFSCIV